MCSISHTYQSLVHVHDSCISLIMLFLSVSPELYAPQAHIESPHHRTLTLSRRNEVSSSTSLYLSFVCLLCYLAYVYLPDHATLITTHISIIRNRVHHANMDSVGMGHPTCPMRRARKGANLFDAAFTLYMYKVSCVGLLITRFSGNNEPRPLTIV